MMKIMMEITRNAIAADDDITARMYICTSIRRDPDSSIFPIQFGDQTITQFSLTPLGPLR